jgi:hypothetical protein
MRGISMRIIEASAAVASLAWSVWTAPTGSVAFVFATEDADETEVKSCRFSGLNLRVLRGGIRIVQTRPQVCEVN